MNAAIPIPRLASFAARHMTEFLPNAEPDWRDCPSPDWSAPASAYRVKQEPKWRPWKQEEVFIGAEVWHKENRSRRLICAAFSGKIFLGPDCYTGNGHTPEEVLKDYEFLAPGGFNYRPCGVQEG